MNVTINKIIGLIIILIVIFVNSVNAEDIEEVIALEDALLSAYRNNPDVLAARKIVGMAQAKYKQTKVFPNPELELEVDKFPKDLEGNKQINSRIIEGEVKFSQDFEVWGKRGLKQEIAQDEIGQAEADFQTVWLDIVRRIREQYTEVLLDQKRIDLAKENLDLARRFLDQVQVRFNSGKARNHELVRARLELAKVRRRLLEAEKEFRLDSGKLNILMGRKMDIPIKLKDDLTHTQMQRTFEDLFAIALNQRPDILSQEKEVSKQEKEVKLAKRKWLPDFGIGLFANREDEVYSAGAAISFELPFWNQYRGEIEEAKLKKDTTEINLDALRRKVELDVYTAFQEVVLAQQQLDILEEAINEVNELLRITTLRYEEGEISFLAYLENLAAYRETKQEYFESLANYARKLAILEQVIGKPIELRRG